MPRSRRHEKLWKDLQKQIITITIVLGSVRGFRQIISKGMVKPIDMCRLSKSAWCGGRSVSIATLPARSTLQYDS